MDTFTQNPCGYGMKVFFMNRYCIDSTYQEPEERVSHSRGRTFLDNPRERIPEKTEMEARDLMVVQAVFHRCQSKLWTLTRLLVCRR